MKVVLFGATGMVGRGALLASLAAADVEEVLVVTRSPTGQGHPKLRELIHKEFADLSRVQRDMAGFDACFFALGVTAAGKSEAEYTHLTYDFALEAGRAFAAVNPGAVFVYVSGVGTDSTEAGRVMWARVKGRTENALLALPLKAYMFRPGFIRPLQGIRSKTRLYQTMYDLMRPLSALLVRLAPTTFLDTERVGQAMLAVAADPPQDHVLEPAAIHHEALRRMEPRTQA